MQLTILYELGMPKLGPALPKPWATCSESNASSSHVISVFCFWRKKTTLQERLGAAASQRHTVLEVTQASGDEMPAAVEDSVPLVAFDTGRLLLTTGAIAPALHPESDSISASAHGTPRSLHASLDTVARTPARKKSSQHSSECNRGGDPVRGECVRILDNHGDAVCCCDWSRAEGGRRFVLSGSGDETLRVWDLDAGLSSNCTRVLKGHTGAVWCCQFSQADGGRRWALSGSRDKTLRIFDVETGDCTAVLQGHQGSVQACSWSVGDAAGLRIASASTDKSLKVWDRSSASWLCTSTLLGHSAAIMCAVWSEADGGGRWLLSGSDDTTLRIWDAHSGRSERTLQEHAGPVLCCAFSKADGGRRWALSGSWDMTVNLWDCCALLVQNETKNNDSSLVLKLLGHTAPVFCCSFSHADGGNCWALTGAYDQTLRIWALSSGSCLSILEGHTRWVRSCCWSNADGGKRWFLSGSRDKTLRVWELDWEGKVHSNGRDEGGEVLKQQVGIARAALSPLRSDAPREHHAAASEISDYGIMAQDRRNGVKDMAQRLLQAEEETQSVRQLLRAKHAEAEAGKMRCDEMEAEVEALVRSLRISKQTANELQQRVSELEIQVMATRKQAKEEVAMLREEHDRLTQEFSRAREEELARVSQAAQAEADLAIKHAMGEVSKVSASNDRLAASLGDLEEAREKCRQDQVEAARLMAEVVQREIAVKVRETAVAHALRKNGPLREEGTEGREGEKISMAERDAERIRKDAADAAKEVADRMSEAIKSNKFRESQVALLLMCRGILSCLRAERSLFTTKWSDPSLCGQCLGSVAEVSTYGSSPHTSPRRPSRGSNPTGALKPSPSPFGSVMNANQSTSSHSPPRDPSPGTSVSSTLASLSPSSSTRDPHDQWALSPASLAGNRNADVDVPVSMAEEGLEDARNAKWVATRHEWIAVVTGDEAGHAQVREASL